MVETTGREEGSVEDRATADACMMTGSEATASSSITSCQRQKQASRSASSVSLAVYQPTEAGRWTGRSGRIDEGTKGGGKLLVCADRYCELLRQLVVSNHEDPSFRCSSTHASGCTSRCRSSPSYHSPASPSARRSRHCLLHQTSSCARPSLTDPKPRSAPTVS